MLGASTIMVRPLRSAIDLISGCANSSCMLLSPPMTMIEPAPVSAKATELSTPECAIWKVPLAMPSRMAGDPGVNCRSMSRP